jgi:hypothetical protein
VVSPVNASRLPSRAEPRASLGVGAVGYSLPREGLSPPILCQLSWRTPLRVRNDRIRMTSRCPLCPQLRRKKRACRRLISMLPAIISADFRSIPEADVTWTGAVASPVYSRDYLSTPLPAAPHSSRAYARCGLRSKFLIVRSKTVGEHSISGIHH